MSRHFRIAVLFFSALALAFTVVPASAQIYDDANDFSTAGNPNGVWSYGWSSTLGSSFNLDTGLASGTQIDEWYNTTIQNNLGTFPFVVHNKLNTTFVSTTQRIQPHQVVLHPGPGGEYSIVRWTAPTAGTWTLDASFIGQDVVGTTTDVHILDNGLSLFSGNINGYLNTKSYINTLSFTQGDILDVAVGFGSNCNYFYDSTGVSLRLSAFNPVPEPGNTALLLVGGMAGVGLFLRRRRANRVV